jgi:hypothetical protein
MAKQPSDVWASFANRDRQARLEARAKLAYDAFSQSAGVNRGIPYPPFSRLPSAFIEAWKHLVEALDTDPRCWECGAEMICPKCKEATR